MGRQSQNETCCRMKYNIPTPKGLNPICRQFNPFGVAGSGTDINHGFRCGAWALAEHWHKLERRSASAESNTQL